MTTIRQTLLEVALEKGLRQSTVVSYETLLTRLGVIDVDAALVDREQVMERLWAIDSPNTRGAAVIALRSVLGWSIKIPKGAPRRYDLPAEDTLRLALMCSTHEVRGLLMMYAGLRIGEACAITLSDVSGDRLRVDKQVLQLHRTGQPTVLRIAPVKTTEAEIVVPRWLSERVASLTETVKPDAVRGSLRRSGTKVGIRLNPHMLRHWYATTLLSRGVPLIVVSRQMRHSDVATTLRTYAQFDDGKEIRQALG